MFYETPRVVALHFCRLYSRLAKLVNWQCILAIQIYSQTSSKHAFKLYIIICKYTNNLVGYVLCEQTKFLQMVETGARHLWNTMFRMPRGSTRDRG